MNEYTINYRGYAYNERERKAFEQFKHDGAIGRCVSPQHCAISFDREGRAHLWRKLPKSRHPYFMHEQEIAVSLR